MPYPQPGLFALGTRSHLHLELDVREGADPVEVLARLQDVREPASASGGLNMVVGFGADLWRRLRPDACPDDHGDFEEIRGRGAQVAPATQHDVWIWLHGSGQDELLQLGLEATNLLRPVAELAHERPAFIHLSSRDITGFEDGTENPTVWEAHDVALVPEGEKGAGGAHALLQVWHHDLARFRDLPDDEQEAVIGRTKATSEELPEDVMPPDSHVSRTVLEGPDGEELEVFRRSAPWGTVREHGLVFVGFTKDPKRLLAMLERMYGVSGDGLHDRITEFSRAITGARYFVPAIADLHSDTDGLS